MAEKTDTIGFANRIEKLASTTQSQEERDSVGRACTLFRELCLKKGTPADLSRIEEAISIAVEELHLGNKAVICLLLKEHFDQGYLSEEQLSDAFGPGIVHILSGLKKMDRLDKKQFKTNAENFIRLLITLSDDIHVILLRLGLQISGMRHIAELPADRGTLLAEETALIFVPIAHRIGLYRIKTELEDRVLSFREPRVFAEIEMKMKEVEKEIDLYAAGFIRPIEQILRENGFTMEIRSRVKSISSIWKKMQKQQVEFEKVYDLFAIRIILNETVESEKADCWKVYSLVTDIYPPNPKRLRDWTTFPKANGYESLHATVAGPSGRWVEVQIRTRRMDEIAEKGFAAHWKYKSGGARDSSGTIYARIREMLENSEVSSGEHLMSEEKKALYSDEIFIFTPKGDLKRLKAGYSVLDFAYEIHTQIGSTCTGAVVNGKMVPLRHILQNGDTVRILTSKNQKPGPGWLEIVKSPRTLARIKHALKMETYRDSEVGKEIIKLKVSALGKELTDPVINSLIHAFGCDHVLDLYQKVGEGKIDPLRIRKVLALPEPVQINHKARATNFPERVSEVLTGREDYVIIDPAIRSLHYQFSRCCNPVPDNPIFAFVSVLQGIKIHRTECKNAVQLITKYPYRVLEARWKEPSVKVQKK